MGTVYGYARVSSAGQCLNRQLDALALFPVEAQKTFCDTASGKDFDRPQYRKLMRRMKPGDVLVVQSIDRLGRSYRDILEEWRTITKVKSCAIVVLDMPLLDTRVSAHGITGEFLADMVLQMLSYVAQIERESIRQRQAEGIAAAKARGVLFGRPKKARPENFGGVAHEYACGRISQREAGRRLGVSVSTFLRWVAEYDSQQGRIER